MSSGKICFVSIRYGEEVNGGAELHCRQLAEHMKRYYDHIDVLTSRAKDYMTWRNEYPEGGEMLNGIRVIRFSTVHERDQEAFDEINLRLLQDRLAPEDEKTWFELQGPYMPSMIHYLREHKNDYDAIIFMAYLYYPTVMGLPEAAERAIFLPLAHDEPFLKMQTYQRLFHMPRFFLYNTDEERRMVHYYFENEEIPDELGGVGVDLPNTIDPAAFREKFGINDPFLLYIGRIDDYGKNCGTLFRYFQEYKHRQKGDLKLVLMGKAVMDIPEDPDIISLGFVSDEDKFNGLKAAEMLVLPSRFESLSMVVLEAMSVGTSVLVNGESPVLKAHCVKSNGALYYNGYLEYEGAVRYLLEHPEEVRLLHENAHKYVQTNYMWDVITEKLHRMIEAVSGSAPARQ